MKTLFVMRHAKSSWDNSALSDHDRPLNARGLRDAPRMGAFLVEETELPAAILSSTAARAYATATLVAEASGFAGDIQRFEDLYLAGPGRILSLVATEAKGLDRVMTVSHNPGVEELVRFLTGEIERMPTAAVAWIELPIDSWDALERGVGKLRAVWRPKEVL